MKGLRYLLQADERVAPLKPDPEKWIAVFARDKRGARLRGDHAQIKRQSGMTIRRKIITL
jgi:hypothetical protein